MIKAAEIEPREIGKIDLGKLGQELAVKINDGMPASKALSETYNSSPLIALSLQGNSEIVLSQQLRLFVEAAKFTVRGGSTDKGATIPKKDRTKTIRSYGLIIRDCFPRIYWKEAEELLEKGMRNTEGPGFNDHLRYLVRLRRKRIKHEAKLATKTHNI